MERIKTFIKEPNRVSKLIVGIFLFVVFSLVFGQTILAQFQRSDSPGGWGWGYGYGYGQGYGYGYWQTDGSYRTTGDDLSTYAYGYGYGYSDYGVPTCVWDTIGFCDSSCGEGNFFKAGATCFVDSSCTKSCGGGTNTVSGIVYNSQGGTITGATISISGFSGSDSATSFPSGYYFFDQNIRYGHYLLTASAAGYNNTSTYILVTGSETNNLTLTSSGGGEDPPLTPINLLATAISTTRIDLTWFSVPEATSYNLYFDTDPDFTDTSTITGIGTHSYSHTGLSISTTYYYKVSAVNSGGESDLSEVVSTSTLGFTGEGAVCIGEACDYDTLSEALDATDSGDTVYVRSNYVSSTESFPLTIDDNITIDCQNNGAMIATSTTSTIEVTGGHLTIQNCTLQNVGINVDNGYDLILTSSTINLYEAPIIYNQDYGTGAFVYTNDMSSDFTATSNTVNVYFIDNHNVFYLNAINDAIITNNYFNYLSTEYSTVLNTIQSQGAYDITITGNYFKWPVNHDYNNIGVFFFQSYYGYEDRHTANVEITNNTIHLNDDETPRAFYFNSFGYPISASVSYNIFYSSASNNTDVQAMECEDQYDDEYYCGLISDYNGFYNIGSTITYSGPEITHNGGGTHNTTTDPLFISNTLYLQPYSTYLDVNGNLDIGAYSAAYSPLVSPPDMPTNLVATPVSNARIDLSWDSVSGATSYNLYRDTNPSFTATTTISGIEDTSYNNTGLSPSTTYYYKVSAVNGIGEGDLSEVVSTSTLGFTGEGAVCVDGVCSYESLLAGLAASSDDSTVNIRSNYVSSSDSYPIIFPTTTTNLTIDCQSSGATFANSTGTSTSNYFQLRRSTIIQNCNFEDVGLNVNSGGFDLIGEHQHILGNNFVLNSPVGFAVGGGTGALLGSNSDGAMTGSTFSSNIVNIYYGSDGSGNPNLINLIGTESLVSHVEDNRFVYHEAPEERLGMTISIGKGSTVISGNYIQVPSTTPSTEFGPTLGIYVSGRQDNTSTSVANITHNTIDVGSSCGVGIYYAGATPNTLVNNTANINYNLINGVGCSDNSAIIINKSSPTSTVTLNIDYNGVNDFSETYSLSGNYSSEIVLNDGGHNFIADPLFITGTLQPSPISAYLDINGDLDVGAYAGTRTTGTIYIDDDGEVDYEYVHATSTSIISGLRTGDTVSIATGTYSGFTINSSSMLAGDLTITGAGAETIIDVTGAENGIYLNGINTTTIQDLVVQNASTTSQTFNITRHPFSYDPGDGLHNYDASMVGGNGLVILYPGNGDFGSTWITTNDYNITDYVSTTPQNWHLSLINVFGSYITAYLRNDLAEDCEAADLIWGDLIGGPDDFCQENVLVWDAENNEYDYNAPVGPTVITSYQEGEPDIAVNENYYAGIKFANANNNTISSVTSTDNSYGVWFSGDSDDNFIMNSTISNSLTYDLYSDSTGDNSLGNVDYDFTSSTVGTGFVANLLQTRVFVTSTNGAVEGVSVSVTDNNSSHTENGTTGADGYSEYNWISYFDITSSTDGVDATTTSGNYNPYTISAETTGDYSATSTQENLIENLQTFTLVMDYTGGGEPPAAEGGLSIFMPQNTNLFGAENTLWTFNVTTSEDLVPGDVVQFQWPYLAQADNYHLQNASLLNSSNITLYQSYGMGGGVNANHLQYYGHQGQGDMLFGYVDETIPAGTQFHVAIRGINNPYPRGGFGQANPYDNILMRVVAGTPEVQEEPFGALTEKVNATTTFSLDQLGDRIVSDYNSNIIASSYATGTVAQYTFSFTATSSIPSVGKVVLVFPDGFDISGAYLSETININNSSTPAQVLTSGVTTSTANGMNRVILRVSNASTTAGDVITATIKGIRNPVAKGVYRGLFVYTAVSNMGLIDGSFGGFNPNDYQGPPPVDTIHIGGNNTVNVEVYKEENGSRVLLSPEEAALMKIGMDCPDKKFYVGDRYLNSSASARFENLLDCNYNIWIQPVSTDKSVLIQFMQNYLPPNRKMVRALDGSTATGTLTFGVPDATLTFSLDNLPANYSAGQGIIDVNAYSDNYMGFSPVFTNTNYNVPGTNGSGQGFARIKVKQGETWKPGIQGGTLYVGGKKYWPPNIPSVYIGTSTVEAGNYSYVLAEKNLTVTIRNSADNGVVTDACVSVQQVGSGDFMGRSQDQTCNPNSGNNYQFKVPEGQVEVNVERFGGKTQKQTVQVGASGATTTVYLAAPTNFIAVNVVDSEGNNISGAGVFAHGSSGNANGVTDTNGSANLYVNAGIYTVDAFIPGFANLTPTTTILGEGQNVSTTFIVDASRFKVIRGRVYYDNNSNDTYDQGVDIAVAGVKMFANTNGKGGGAETADDGTYSIYVNGNGTYEVGGWSRDTGRLDFQTVILNDSASGVDWAMGESGTLEIELQNASQVDKLFIGIFNPATQRGSHSGSWLTDGTSKKTSINLPAGNYRLDIGSPSGPIVEGQNITVNGGETTNLTYNATAEITWVTVSGTVTLGGNPVSGANVWLARRAGPGFYSTQTDTNGEYSMVVPGNRFYFSGVEYSGYIANEGEVEINLTTNDEEQNFTLVSAPYTISGELTNASHETLTEGWVEVGKMVNGREVRKGSPVDASGYYSINVTEGDWRVIANSPCYYRSQGQNVTVSGGSVDAPIELTVMPGCSVDSGKFFTVIDTNGGQIVTNDVIINIPANALGTSGNAVNLKINRTGLSAGTSNATPIVPISINAIDSDGSSITSLNSPVEITYKYNENNLPVGFAETDLAFGYFSDATGQWESVAGTVDTVNNSVTVQVEHFTDFGPLLPGVPVVPENLVATATSSSQIDLTWNSVDSADYYIIYATTTDSAGLFYEGDRLTTTTYTYYYHTGLDAETTWYYEVAGYNENGEGANSDTDSATTAAAGAAGVTLSNTTRTVAEDSGTATYTVVLDSAPSANVVITVSESSADFSLSPSTLTFTTGNWSTPQTVTITATSDSSVEGTETSTITHSAASSDNNYDGISISNVTVTITDNDSNNSPGGGGGGSFSTAPSAPTVAVSSTIQYTFDLNINSDIYLGNTHHQVKFVSYDPSTGNVVLHVKSTTQKVTIKVGEEKVLDTDLNQAKDLYLKLNSISSDKKTINLTLASLIDLEFTINYNFTTTNRVSTTLYFNSPQATQMAVSNSSDFSSVSFEPYRSIKQWVLTPGSGKKTVYVRFRTAQGGDKIVSDSIILDPSYPYDGSYAPEQPTVINSSDNQTVVTQPIQAFVFTRTLKLGSTGSDVKQLQKYLNANGFTVAAKGVGSIGKETTFFGNATKAALIKYQKANKLKQTGILDQATRNLLNNQKAPKETVTPTTNTTVKYIFKSLLSLGSKGEEVKQLQIRLQELGYLSGTIKPNGVFGPATKAAVVKLQKDNQLTPAVGSVGPKTREVLNRY